MNEFQKAQNVRLLDVFFIGPYLLWIAYRGRVTGWDKLILAVLGSATIGYNLRNYLINR